MQLRWRCRESQQIVDDDVNGTAYAIARQTRQIERLCPDTLARERGIPVKYGWARS